MNILRRSVTVLLLVAVAAALNGCMLTEPFRSVQYYDLQTPAPTIPDDCLVKVSSFKSTETSKQKMVYTEDDCRIIIDDYNKWMQSPNIAVSKYLQTAFSNNSANSKLYEFNVSGNVFLFKIDLKNKLASLGVLYKIAKVKAGTETELINHSCILTSTFQDDDDPADFAKAMSECAKRLADRIQADINYMKQRDNGSSN